jgi:hypothetical protein
MSKSTCVLIRLRGLITTPREGDGTMDKQNDLVAAAEHIYKAWNEALGAKDLELLTHPLKVRSLFSFWGSNAASAMGTTSCAALSVWFSSDSRRSASAIAPDSLPMEPNSCGSILRATPGGEQMDFVEVMELKEGLIHRHRVYRGWFGLSILTGNQH